MKQKELARRLRDVASIALMMDGVTAVNKQTGDAFDMSRYVDGVRNACAVVSLVIRGELPEEVLADPAGFIRMIVGLELEGVGDGNE